MTPRKNGPRGAGDANAAYFKSYRTSLPPFAERLKAESERADRAERANRERFAHKRRERLIRADRPVRCWELDRHRRQFWAYVCGLERRLAALELRAGAGP
jgi:hypothetical protein